jgi:hypothetical protein
MAGTYTIHRISSNNQFNHSPIGKLEFANENVYAFARLRRYELRHGIIASHRPWCLAIAVTLNSQLSALNGFAASGICRCSVGHPA